MKTISKVILDTVEETKQRFYEQHGRNPKDEKKLFINWYIEQNSSTPIDVLFYELERFYLFITEDRIKRILNETK